MLGVEFVLKGLTGSSSAKASQNNNEIKANAVYNHWSIWVKLCGHGSAHQLQLELSNQTRIKIPSLDPAPISKLPLLFPSACYSP